MPEGNVCAHMKMCLCLRVYSLIPISYPQHDFFAVLTIILEGQRVYIKRLFNSPGHASGV